MIRTTLVRLVALGSLVVMPNVASAQWNLSNDWSSSLNPSGVWSYGSRSAGTLASTGFSALPWHWVTAGWADTWSAANSATLPNIAKNITNTTQTYLSIVVQPGDVFMHPSPSGDYSVVRFTAPSTGMYSIVSRFFGVDCCATSTDANVVANGTVVFTDYVNGYGAQTSYANSFALNGGDVLDFAVGFGQNGNYTYDSTGLDLSINAVQVTPEPASLVLVGTGLLGVVGLARRVRR